MDEAEPKAPDVLGWFLDISAPVLAAAVGVADPVAGVGAAGALAALTHWRGTREERNLRSFAEEAARRASREEWGRLVRDEDGAELLLDAMDRATRARGEAHARILAAMAAGAAKEQWVPPRRPMATHLIELARRCPSRR